MNKAETIKILALLQANYPDSFRDMSEIAVNGRVNLWHEVFKDNSYAEVTAAVMAHISSDTNRFMPPVGVIKNKLVELKSDAGDLTELDAWRLVSKATRNGYYGSEEEFAALPPMVQKVVGSPAMLKAWSQLSQEEVETVVQSNFMRSYRAKVKAEKEALTLPVGTKDFIRQIAENGERQPKKLGDIHTAADEKRNIEQK